MWETLRTPKPLGKEQSHCSFCATSLREIEKVQEDSCWAPPIHSLRGTRKTRSQNMMFCTWARGHIATWQPIPVQRSRETWGLPHIPPCFSALLKYSLQKINCAIAALHNPEFVLSFTARAPKTRVGAPTAAGLRHMLALRVLNMLGTHITSQSLLARILVWTCLFTAVSTACWVTVWTLTTQMVTSEGHSLLNNTHSLDVCNSIICIDLHICGQRNNSHGF
jgi:hypothetical protein